MPTVLIALDCFLAEPGTSGAWPEWNKILGCPPSDLMDHPWSNLGITRDDPVDDHVSAAVDKGKEKEKEQVGEGSEGADEGAADTASAGMVEDNAEPDPADRPSKPAPHGRNQSRARSQSRRPRKHVKSAAIVQDSGDEDESIPTPAAHCTLRYNIYNPPNTHQRVDEEAQCMLCVWCRAGSVVECTLVLDYLLYYCLPLLLLAFTLAYVGLYSLLSKAFQC